MADAHRAVNAPAGDAPCRILALAPLPFLQQGAPTFQTGAAVFSAELLRALGAAGHAVHVLAESPPALPITCAGPPWRGDRLSVEWFAAPYQHGDQVLDDAQRQQLRSGLRPRFAARMQQDRPHVVLIGRELSATWVLGLCAEYALPAVVIAHGVATAALLRPDYPRAHRQLLLDSLRRADGVVSVARHLEGTLRDLGVTRVCTIANAVDTERFRPQPKDPALLARWRIAADQIVVAHCSSLKPVKRPLDVVHAAAHVLRHAPGVVYVIVGDGPGRSEMERVARQYGIDAQIRFTGEVAHADMPAHLALADIVVMPSEREALPLIHLETQACGLVLVASDIPGSREAITDGETGLLFRCGDVADCAATTLAAIREVGLRARIGVRARQQASLSSWQACVRAYSAVLAEASLAARIVRSRST